MNRSTLSIKRRKLPKLTKQQARAMDRNTNEIDTIYDIAEVVPVITDILIGAMIEPGRDAERWVRARIREHLAARKLKRYRTYEILVNSQHKDSAFSWLRWYWMEFMAAKIPDGVEPQPGRKVIEVEFTEEVKANI